MTIYLDNSSTTRPFDEVIDLMGKIMREDYGNASSLHRMGMKAEEHMTRAREQMAKALGVLPEEIFFTSGGTESDNTALLCGAAAGKRRGNKVITTCIEHPAILESLERLKEQGFETVTIPVDERGVVDMEAMKAAIDEDTILISCMHVNNETGAIQPISEIAKLKGNALFHVDAVQSFGKLRVPMEGIDLLSISGHKIHGPKGVGVLFVRKGTNIRPFIVGGGQEKHFRSGTENIPGIAGIGLAAEIIYTDREKKNEVLRGEKKALMDILSEKLDNVLFNSDMDGAPHILNVTFEGVRGEVILHMLEQDGIFVSTGSACSSNKSNHRSHVIKAMGRTDDQVDGTIRFSLCDGIPMEDIVFAAEKTAEHVTKFMKLGRFR